MVRKKSCAYLKDGVCRLCKGACRIGHEDMVCKDAVRRVSSMKETVPSGHVRRYALGTPKGRFLSATEGVFGPVVYRACKSKRRYNDEYVAGKEAKKMGSRYGYPMRAYFCPYCNGYHLTSRKQHEETSCHEQMLEVA